jgi:hypothetical protein
VEFNSKGLAGVGAVAQAKQGERTMRERQIEKFLIEKVKDVGGEVRKVQWVGRNGAPDRLVMLPPRDREENPTIWVELKAPGEKPRPSRRSMLPLSVSACRLKSCR